MFGARSLFLFVFILVILRLKSYAFVSRCGFVHVSWGAYGDHQISGAGVTGNCEPPSVGTRSWTGPRKTLSHVSRSWQWSNRGCQDKSVYDVKQCIIVCLSLLRHWRKSLPGNFRNRKCSLKWPGSPNVSTPQRRAGSPNSTLFPPYIPLGHSGSSVLIWICLLSASLCSLPRVWLQRQSPASSWFLEFLSWILLLNKDEGQTN